MIKLIIAVAILTLVSNQVAATSYYNCTFQDDPVYGGIIIERATMLKCNDCSCVGLQNNTCEFGPNDDGEFYTRTDVSSELVDKCEFNIYCTCNEDILAKNVDDFVEVNEETFGAEEDSRVAPEVER